MEFITHLFHINSKNYVRVRQYDTPQSDLSILRTISDTPVTDINSDINPQNRVSNIYHGVQYSSIRYQFRKLCQS